MSIALAAFFLTALVGGLVAKSEPEAQPAEVVVKVTEES